MPIKLHRPIRRYGTVGRSTSPLRRSVLIAQPTAPAEAPATANVPGDKEAEKKGNKVSSKSILEEVIENWDECLVFDTSMFEDRADELAGLIAKESAHRGSVINEKKEHTRRLINIVYPDGNYPQEVIDFMKDKGLLSSGSSIRNHPSLGVIAGNTEPIQYVYKWDSAFGGGGYLQRS